MNKRLELIKYALKAELKRYLDKVVEAVNQDWDYLPSDVVDSLPHGWSLMRGKHNVNSGVINHLIFLIKNLKISEETQGIPMDPHKKLIVIRALAIHGDRSNIEYADTVSMLIDQVSMDIDYFMQQH